jgi:hypothetical protein
MSEEKVRILRMRDLHWWLPGAKGYTADQKAAGLFSIHDALKMARDHTKLDTPTHVIVPLSWRELHSQEETR